ncbi:Uncharacterised protein [uncultured archaeon]|nr:Uncharacterised protein [uncultured archaeon]
MAKVGCYENYPWWIVVLSNFVSIAVYGVGAFIMYQFGLACLVFYLLYVLWLELRLWSGHCVDCYYYGKKCGFGKGKLSALLFKKGDSKKFCKMQISWKDIIPDFLVSLIPMAAGVILLIRDFNWLVLASIILLAVFGFVGSGLVRSQLACKYCKQREIGCPAEQLFNKKK